MDAIQQREQPVQALISARTRSAALDPKAIAFAYNMNIRQVSDAPRPVRRANLQETHQNPEVEAWSRRRRPRPARRRRGRRRRARCCWPGRRKPDREAKQDRQHCPSQREPGQQAISTASAMAEMTTPAAPAVPARTRRKLRFIESRLHKLFDELPQTLPASDVDRFDGERIQRPETALGHAKQRSHSEKPNGEHSHKKQRGPHSKERRCDLVRNQALPRRRQQAVLFRAAGPEQRTA